MGHISVTLLIINSENIIFLINATWEKSFQNVKNFKKAVVNRSWYPENQILLDHLKIDTKDPSTMITFDNKKDNKRVTNIETNI